MKFINIEIQGINEIVFLKKGVWIKNKNEKEWEKKNPTKNSKPIKHEDMIRKLQIIDQNIAFKKVFNDGTLNILKRFPAIIFFENNDMMLKIFETENDCIEYCRKHNLKYKRFVQSSMNYIRKHLN